MTTPSNFASVKLPTELVRQAKEAAQPMRRSTAGQIEYWATLGRVVEHSGRTVQEARDAIERYEVVAKEVRAAQIHTDAAAVDEAPDSLEAIKRRMLSANANADGSLQAHITHITHITHIVAENRQQAVLGNAA